MRMQADQFETVLPKTERFFSPPTKPKPKPKRQALWLIAGLTGLSLGLLMPVVTNKGVKTNGLNEVHSLVQPTPAPVPAAPYVPPTLAPHQLDPIQTTPRAQMVHLRNIGTYENDLMPDGRVLTTLYKGELPSVTSLPRTGATPGDMWYTRNDGHAWVLAPVTIGSQTTGWVDP